MAFRVSVRVWFGSAASDLILWVTSESDRDAAVAAATRHVKRTMPGVTRARLVSVLQYGEHSEAYWSLRADSDGVAAEVA